MEHVKLSEKQRKEFLKSFREIDIQKELKILFEKMKKSSVHILQGTEEFGKGIKRLSNRSQPFFEQLERPSPGDVLHLLQPG